MRKNKPESGIKAARLEIFLGAAVFIALWRLLAQWVGKEIILPRPLSVATTFLAFLSNPEFLSALGATALRGLSAFGVSMATGLVLGFLSGRSPRFARFMVPGLAVVRATPVLAVILLALVWFSSDVVPVFSAVIMAFPVVLADVSAGVAASDPKLIQMARSFGVPEREIIRNIRFPSALPHLLAAARNALGLSWKVVVAGEVLSMPKHAIGTGMQTSRVMLETTEVFAWALAGVLLCALGDLVFSLLSRSFRWTSA